MTTGADGRRVVTVIGAGTIGMGWITLFCARGHTVRVNSTRSEIEPLVRDAIELLAPGLPGPPVDPADLAKNVVVEPDLARAVDGADVVVENTPERLELKQDLFARIGAAAGPRTLLLSSTSTLLPDDMGERMDDSSRLVVAHPFNPPHVVPLVEVVAGEQTDRAAVDEAVAFLRDAGKVPIVLRRAIPAFVANRLQSALLQECIHLVAEGVVSVGELDDAVTSSIGLRWSTVGPFQSFHLGGGEGGLRKWLTTLGAGLQRGWEGLGHPQMTDELIEFILGQAEEAFGDGNYAELAVRRDRLQRAVLNALADEGAGT